MTTAFDSATIQGARGFNPLKLRPLDIYGHKCNYTICPHQDARRKVYPCAPGYSFDELHGTRYLTRCNTWGCEYCGPGKIVGFQTELRYHLKVHRYSSGSVDSRSYLVTLTWKSECDLHCKLHWRDCIDAGHPKTVVGKNGKALSHATMEQYWRRWVVAMRKRYGERMAYCRVKEATKAGVPHYHVVLNSLDGATQANLDYHARKNWNDITKTSYMVETQQTYNDVTSYLAKYLTKDFGDDTRKWRRYSYSNNAVRAPRVTKAYQAAAYYQRDPKERADTSTETDYEWWFGNDSPTFMRHTWAPEDGDFIEKQPLCHDGCQPIGFMSDMRRNNMLEACAGNEDEMQMLLKDWMLDMDYMPTPEILTEMIPEDYLEGTYSYLYDLPATSDGGC